MTNASASPHDMFILGLVNGVQALAMMIVDTDEKRSRLQGLLDKFSERMLASDHTSEDRELYLKGLALVGAAGALSGDD